MEKANSEKANSEKVTLNFIDPSIGFQMVEKYKGHAKPHNRASKLTRAVWFNVEQLEAYIAWIKKEQPGLKPDEIGIRFYFGTYPADTPNHAHRNTLILVSTKKSYNGTVAYNQDFFNNPNNASAVLAPPLNHGELCPDDCGEIEYWDEKR